MTKEFATLLEFQALDFAADKLERQLRTCEERQNTKKYKQIFEASQDSRKKLTAALQALKLEMQQLSAQIDSISADAHKCIDAFPSGGPSDYDEMQKLSVAVKAFSDKAAAVGEQIKRVQQEATQSEQKLNEATDRAADAREKYAVYKEAYDRKREEAAPAINEASAKRDQARTGVSPQLLAKYDRLKEKKIVPTAKLRDSVCSGCNMQLPIAVKIKVSNDELVECENCTRMLYI